MGWKRLIRLIGESDPVVRYGRLPTHGYESFDGARQKLLNNMVQRSWITGASNQGIVAMENKIPVSDPDYTTGDHDGYAQVIAIGSMVAAAPARSTKLN